MADPAAQPAVHQPPRVERQRNGCPAGRAHRLLAQLARQACGLAEQQEHGLLVRARDLDCARPGGGTHQPALHARVDPVDLEFCDQLGDRLAIVLDGGQRERRVGTIQRAQVGSAGEHPGKRRMRGGDHDPVFPAAVAAQLHIVYERVPPRRGSRTLLDLRERVRRVVGQAQAGGSCGQLLDEPRGVLIERYQRPADRGQAVGVRVLEQRLGELGRSVGGEAQPPVLIGPGEVEHAFVVAAAGAATLDCTGELVGHIRCTRQAGEQARERLRALWIEWDAPCPPDGVPPSPWDRAQQLTQALVVGEAQHGLTVSERSVEVGGGHEHRTIGNALDATPTPRCWW
jgi:hypothetical protein